MSTIYARDRIQDGEAGALAVKQLGEEERASCLPL